LIAKDIAKIFMKIGQVEMRHLDLLAEAVIAFGGDPKFAGKSRTHLSGKWIGYGMGLKQILRTACWMRQRRRTLTAPPHRL